MTEPVSAASQGIAAPAAKASRRSPVFLVALVSSAVVFAAGYTVLKGQKGAGESGAHSAAFAPPLDAAAEGASEAAKPQSASAASKDNAAKAAAPAAADKAASAAGKPAAAKAPKDVAKAATAAVAAKAPQPKAAVAKAAVAKAPVTKAAVKEPVAKAPMPGAPAVQAAAAQAPAAPRLAQAPRALAAAGEWPQYRGPARDGVSRETGWLKGTEAQVLWKANIGTGFSAVAVTGGRAYTMGNGNGQDVVWCLDAATGKEIWRYSYPCELMANSHEGGPSATPTVDGNLVFTYSKAGHLHALDAGSGKLIWSKNIPKDFGGRVPQWGITSVPVVEGNSLYVMAGAPGACIIAFDKNTGAVQWKAGDDGPSYAALQIFRWENAPYLAAFNAGGVVFYKLKDGQQLWRYTWKTSYDVNAAMPVIFGDKVFISSGYNTGCALLQSTKDQPLLWQNRDMRNHFNSSVLVNGYIYGFDESEVACLDWNTGRVMWKQGRLGKGSLMAADGKLIVLSERGELVIAEASPQGFKPLARSQVLGGKCWTMPVLANGRIYARNAAGDLVCVKFG